MGLSDRILLLDDRFDLLNLKPPEPGFYQAIVCLFWIAPSTKDAISRKTQTPCYGLADLFRDEWDWGKEAHILSSEIVNEPSNGDESWRTYLDQPLYEELHIIPLLIELAKFVIQLRQKWGLRQLIVEGALPGRSASLLSQVFSNYSGLIYRPLAYFSQNPAKDRPSLLARLSERLREVVLVGNWKRPVVESMEWLDKTYRWRIAWGSLLRKPQVSEKKVTFFSSYENNSRILSSFVDLMPWPVHWVLNNESARRPLPAGSTQHSYIWQYSIPGESASKINNKETRFTTKKTADQAFLLKSWLATSSTCRSWKRGESSLIAALTKCWEAYLDEARPLLIVMANQWGIEGWFTQIARDRNIPVLQVMHGVLSGYLYTQTPILSDRLVVYGDFWRNLWREDQREKILVYNPKGCFREVKKLLSPKRRLTFFSWPLLLASFYNSFELMDGFIRIFSRVLSQGDYEVMVRAHPLENPSDFKRRWQRLIGALPAELSIGKYEPLPQVLARTDVALMFRSTVMLNCLASGIPIVMPGWINFGWNPALSNTPGIYLATDFPDLEERIREWLDCPPLVDKKVAEQFIASPCAGREAFNSIINKVVANHSAGSIIGS